MIKINTAQVWVLDQDEAVAFWTEKVGFEIREDASFPELGGFRWVTVGAPGQDFPTLVLMDIPGAPVFPDSTVAEIKSLLAKGHSGGIFLETDDVQKAYEEMSAKGVEFTDLPERRPYGIDAGFRDPSGNSFRIMQPLPE
ncbi:VOC family protein [Nocardioides panacihumi]|uniref:VOC family protein n=1 Tax=Nocardioides panacihumi TaxID=400774 RepID=A0ABP5CVP0_9ACTN